MTETLIIERTFVGAPERVYQALTDIDLIEHWLVPHPDMDAEILIVFAPGGAWRLHVPDEFTFEGTMVDFREPEFVEFTWRATPAASRWLGLAVRDDSSEDFSTARFDLAATEAGTRLQLTHSGLDVLAVGEVESVWDRCLGRLASIL